MTETSQMGLSESESQVGNVLPELGAIPSTALSAGYLQGWGLHQKFLIVSKEILLTVLIPAKLTQNQWEHNSTFPRS